MKLTGSEREVDRNVNVKKEKKTNRTNKNSPYQNVMSACKLWNTFKLRNFLNWKGICWDTSKLKRTKSDDGLL